MRTTTLAMAHAAPRVCAPGSSASPAVCGADAHSAARALAARRGSPARVRRQGGTPTLASPGSRPTRGGRPRCAACRPRLRMRPPPPPRPWNRRRRRPPCTACVSAARASPTRCAGCTTTSRACRACGATARVRERAPWRARQGQHLHWVAAPCCTPSCKACTYTCCTLLSRACWPPAFVLHPGSARHSGMHAAAGRRAWGPAAGAAGHGGARGRGAGGAPRGPPAGRHDAAARRLGGARRPAPGPRVGRRRPPRWHSRRRCRAARPGARTQGNRDSARRQRPNWKMSRGLALTCMCCLWCWGAARRPACRL